MLRHTYISCFVEIRILSTYYSNVVDTWMLQYITDNAAEGLILSGRDDEA